MVSRSRSADRALDLLAGGGPASAVIPYAGKIQIPGNAWNVGVAPS